MSKRILVAGIDEIDPSKFEEPMDEKKNIFFGTMNKPEGCLWGSTYTPDAAYPSDWIRWVQDECYEVEKYNHGIVFRLNQNARICEIDSVESYREMMKTFKITLDVHSKSEMSWWKNPISVNWAELSKAYDAFHLTEDAFWSMRLPMDDRLDTDEGILPNFYAYDCETWIIFNLDCINKGSILNLSIPLVDCWRDF